MTTADGVNQAVADLEAKMKSKEVQGFADKAMFVAEPHDWVDGKGVMPSVYLLNMTPDPLGSVAAMAEMYKGHVIRDLEELTDEERMAAWIDVQKTHLRAPMEAIKFHFMIEGVDRAFTHQMVRQRTAVYAQESMRFAVVEDLEHAVSLPPSLQGLPDDAPARVFWDETMDAIKDGYERLVGAGMPQEDARGLLPHAVATRLNFITDQRNLIDHAGNRLCTQAQFHWRVVFSQMVVAIRNYKGPGYEERNDWQYKAIAESPLWRPVCYQLGRCPFLASFDRSCSIRERVENQDWEAINPAEWLLDPSAAR